MLSRKYLAALTALFLSSAATCRAQDASSAKHWVTVWGASQYAPFSFTDAPVPQTPMSNVTLRMIVRPTLSGGRLRIRLENADKKAAVHIGAAHIALAGKDSATVPGTDRTLTFGGSPQIIIPAGAPILSDPVELSVAAFANLSVSLYLPDSTLGSTSHKGSQQESYLASGDLTAAPQLPDAKTEQFWYFLSTVDMLEPQKTKATVAFGDSITEGSNNLPKQYTDYPDQLARRLAGQAGSQSIAIVNEGIGGNRILHNGFGDSALARFDRDVLTLPGVSNVILLEGINDIGFPRVRMAEVKGFEGRENLFVKEKVSAEELTQGLQQLAARAHEHGLKVFCSTIMPFEGTNSFGEEGEAIRTAVNKWILGSKVFDGIFDFDAVVRDPARPSHVLPAFDSGDHIHPSPAGYKAMADSINLSLLR